MQKLSSTAAFIAFDLQTGDGDAPAVGVTRLARKVLPDGAELLARSTTYSFASFGLQRGGASAGIDAEGDAKDAAVAAFIAEVEPLVASGAWATDPSVGLTEADLAPLRIHDSRPTIDTPALVAAGAVAAAKAAGWDGTSAVVVGGGPIADAALAALGSHGTSGALTDAAGALFVAGRAGVIDHDAAATVQAQFVVPLTPVPVTARAHAVLGRAGVVHVPDFLALAAPLLAAHDADGGDPVERITQAVLALDGTDLWMSAVTAAEAFLATWQDTLPFGRPLA